MLGSSCATVNFQRASFQPVCFTTAAGARVQASVYCILKKANCCFRGEFHRNQTGFLFDANSVPRESATRHPGEDHALLGGNNFLLDLHKQGHRAILLQEVASGDAGFVNVIPVEVRLQKLRLVRLRVLVVVEQALDLELVSKFIFGQHLPNR